jgi:glycosyltransferase involved in cell wall biosynthesis
MRQIGPEQPAGKFITIRNGYDPSDFTDEVAPSRRFEVIHTGTFYQSRQPDVLVQGFLQFLDRVPVAARNARLRLFGTSLDTDVATMTRAPQIEVRGWTQHADIVRALRESAVLLMVQHSQDGVELTIPGKVYEYMATGNHILALQGRHRELDRILRAYGHSTLLRAYEPRAVAAALEGLYSRWSAGELATRRPPAFVARFSRIEASRKLADLLERACSNRRKCASVDQRDVSACVHPAGFVQQARA